jgi:hypothetical protein
MGSNAPLPRFRKGIPLRFETFHQGNAVLICLLSRKQIVGLFTFLTEPRQITVYAFLMKARESSKESVLGIPHLSIFIYTIGGI